MGKLTFAGLIFFILSLMGSKLLAQGLNDYRSVASGNWATASTWQRFDGTDWVAAITAPVSTDGQITIRSPHSVNYNLNSTIDEVLVESGATLSINGGFAINNGAADHDVIVNGNLNFFAGTISGTGTLLVNGTMIWSSSFGQNGFLAPATISASGTLNIGGSYAVLSGSLINNGTTNLSSGALGFSTNGAFINNATFNITNTATDFGYQEVAPGFTNSSTGTVTKTNSGSFLLGTNFTNEGTLTIQTGTWQNGGGTTFTNSGSIGLSNNAVFRNSGSTIQFNSGTSISGTGTVQIAGGTTSFNSAVNLPSTVGLDFSLGTINGTGSLSVNGIMNWNSGFGNHGYVVSTTITQTGTLNIGGSYAVLSSSLTNNGTTNLSSGALGFGANGAFTNNATFNITNTATDFGFQGTAPGFINSPTGVINKSSSEIFTVGINSFSNAGTININAGTWIVSGGGTFENTGSIALSNNAVFRNSGPTIQFNSGTSISGTGILQFSGGTTSFNTAVNLPSTVGLDFTIGLLTGSGSLTVNGVMNWNSGFGNHGYVVPTTISETGTLNIGGSYAVLSSSLTNNGTTNLTSGSLGFGANGAFTNNGTLNITNTATYFGFQGSGPGFINGSTGTVIKSSTGTFTFGIPSSNSGLIKGIGTLQISSTFTNTGKINPGLSPGILVLNGTQPLSASSTLEIEITGNAGAGLANGHDQVQREGNLTLAGTLTVAETGTVPNGDYVIVTLSSGSITGTFATTNLPPNYSLVYNTNNVILRKDQPVVNVVLSGALTGNFTTLGSAFAFINSQGGSGNVTATILGNTSETSQVVLNQTGYTVLVVPEGNRTVSGNLSTPLVLLNGADNVTIDGLGFDGNNRLTIRNINTGSEANAIRIFGSANTNTIRRSTLEGSGVGNTVATAVVALNINSTELAENNTIDNNLIRPASSSGVINGIVVSSFNPSGTGRINNTLITNNRIENAFVNNSTNLNHGIYSRFNVNNLTIEGNSIYNTSTFTNSTNGSNYFGIRASNAPDGLGAGVVIRNNFVGGTEPEAKGGKMVISSAANSQRFVGILLEDNTSATSRITGNVVKNLSLDIANPTTSALSPFIGIWSLSGNVQEYNQNMVGDSLVNNSILLTMRPGSTGGLTSNAHLIQTAVATDIANNFVGGLTITTNPIAGSSVAPGISVFSVSGNHPSLTLRNNKIGSDLEGSISITSNTSGSFLFRGLIAQNSNLNPVSVLDKNTVQNITVTNRVDLLAITYFNNTSSATPNVSITNNKIQKIRVSGTGGGLAGIFYNSNGPVNNLSQTLQVSGNHLTDLIGVSGTNLNLTGIRVQNLSPDVNRMKGSISGNTVRSMTNLATGSSGISRGIAIAHDITIGDSLVVAENLIEKISSATEFVTSNNVGTSMGLSYGAVNSGTNGLAIIRDNTIKEIASTSTANLALTAFGISLFGNNLLVERNKVFDLTNAATSPNGKITGIYIQTRTDDSSIGRIQNNKIALNTTSPVKIQGIELGDGVVNSKIYHNSVLIEGNSTTSSYALFKKAVAIADVKNNILYNATQGSGTAFSLGLETSANGYTGTNNYLVSPAAASLAEIGGAAQTLDSWKSITSQDSESREAESGITTISDNLFTDKSVADLLIKVENIGEASRISDKGIAIPTVTKDFQGEARNATTPDIGADEFELAAPCVPEVSIAADPGNEVCEGTSVTFIATPVNGGNAPIYQWKLNGNNVGTNSPTYTNATLVNGDQVTVVMTSSASCAVPTEASSNTVTMTVTDTIAPEVSIAANPGNEICEGTSVTFTATSVNGGDAPIYQWKLNGNNVGTNSATYTNAALANGDQVSVLITSSDACASPSSATSNTVTMSVTNTLVPSVSIVANPGNEICTGTSVTFTATPVNGGDAPVYQWKLNGNNVGTNSPTYTNPALANGDEVSVVMTSSATCASPTSATSNTVTMTVTSTLIPSVSIAANPGTTVCEGTSVTFTATPVNGGDAPIYQWKLNGNNVGTNSPTYNNVALANGDQVSVVMTSSSACASPNPVTSNTVTMTVTSTLVPSVSIAANPGNTICSGTPVTFTATPVNGGDTPSYQWKLNGVNVGDNSPTFTNATLKTNDVIQVVMTSSAACVTSPITNSNVVTILVTTAVTPSVSITSSAGSAICPGTGVNFTASPINGGANPVYQWKLNGVNVGTNSRFYSSSTLQNGDQVNVVMTSSASCVTTSSASSNILTMTVTPSVTPSVTITSDQGSDICEGTNVTFRASPVNGGISPVYQWKRNGANVGTNSPLYSTSTLRDGERISLVMTSSAACASPSTATSNEIIMNLPSFSEDDTPRVRIEANPGNSICSGTLVTFTATPSFGGDNPVYQWKLNGVNVGTNSRFYSSPSLQNGDRIEVFMSNAGCSFFGPDTAFSNIITMTVTNRVAPSVSIVANPGNAVCPGTSVTFTATPVNGGPTPAYQWKLNGVNVGTNSPTYTNSNLANGDQVRVEMTTSSTCTTSVFPVTSNTVTMSVSNPVVPSVTIVSNIGTAICEGRSVTFTATPVNGGASPVYQWKLNGTNVGSNSRFYTNSTLKNGDQVSVVMTSSAACANPNPATSNTVTMSVTETVIPSVSIVANPGNEICAGTSVTFTATPVNGGNAPVYQWKLNGNNVGTNSPTYINASLVNGDQVSVVVTSSAACASPNPATS
ncbi:hypothetical protein, partial [Algoriphagus sp. AK58]|uniref:beta strand repeat-containing protein n=1 Tax=Algoriphagus sp. AK58 TaxID=1406877 RepID=UPI0016506C28